MRSRGSDLMSGSSLREQERYLAVVGGNMGRETGRDGWLGAGFVIGDHRELGGPVWEPRLFHDR